MAPNACRYTGYVQYREAKCKAKEGVIAKSLAGRRAEMDVTGIELAMEVPEKT